MRPSAAALLAAALAACGSDSAAGKAVGAACAAAGECSAGLTCFEGACAASYPPAASCASPPGSPAIVRGDPVVVPEYRPGECVTRARDPAPPDGFTDLGSLPVGRQVALDVPAGTTSLTIVSQDLGTAPREITFQGFRLPNTPVPTDVLLPDGALFFSDTAALPRDSGGYDDVTGVWAYYGGFTPIAGSLTFPNTARSLDLVRTGGQLPPGTWRLTVNDWALECLSVRGCLGGSAAGTYRLHAYARPGPFASTGALDLEVYLATNPAGALPDAAAAVADPQVVRWVSKLSEHFARGGICVGTVTFRDLPAWARARYAPAGQVDISGAGPQGSPPAGETLPGCDNLSQLFTVAVTPSRAVHLFVADELVDDSTAGSPLTVLGIDGSIPGPSGVPGTVNGGAIVGFFAGEGDGGLLGAEGFTGACRGTPAGPFQCGTDVLAYVAAHEAGHWLGLYHTTESFGTSFDPLGDTGRCPCRQCVPSSEAVFCAENGVSNPTFAEASFCNGSASPLAEVAGRALPGAGCSGARNLMFWQFDASLAEGQLTPQQGEIMRLNPAVR